MKICSRQAQFELMSVNHSARSGGIIGLFLSIFYNVKVYCVFSLESPHRGTVMSAHKIPFSIFDMNNTLYYPRSAILGFFQRTHEKVRNSHGKKAISVRATEVVLYFNDVVQ